ncbi:MAG: hypothetical protein COA42_08250 [Alteromonadaceae bacterium]|nr:MAG: hypothetical protein COA42_08250 [Alteromonadaceae bacterium]
MKFKNKLTHPLRLTLTLALIWALVAGQSYAQEPDKKRPSRRSQVLSMHIYKPMNAVQKAMQNEDYPLAQEKLLTLLNSTKRLKPYDKAKIYEMLSSVSAVTEDYTQAANYTEQALQLDSLNQESTKQLYRRLFTLYFFIDENVKSIKALKTWFTLEENPDIHVLFTAAQIYALNDQYEQAFVYAEQGMTKLHSDSSTKIRENWYQLSISIQLKLANYQKASVSLEQAISLWPNKSAYFQQLAAVYQQLDRSQESLAILSIAYQSGLVKRTSELRQLANQYRFFEYPYKGAEVIAEGLSNKHIPNEEEHWEEYANSWLHAKEWERANQALGHAANLSDSGKHWLRLCQTSVQEDDWISSRDYCQKALDKGRLAGEQNMAWYLLGLSNYYQDHLPVALKAFDNCSDAKDTGQDCQHWKHFITQTLQEHQEHQQRQKDMDAIQEQRRQQQQDKMGEALLLKG